MMASAAESGIETHKKRMLGYFALLAMASLIWSAQGTAVKFLDRHMGPIAITFVPFYITTLLFVPLLIRKRRANPQASRPTWSDWAKFTLAGVLGQVLAQLGMTWGISRSLASNGAVLNLMIPVITAVLASFMLREKLTETPHRFPGGRTGRRAADVGAGSAREFISRNEIHRG